MRHRSAGRKLNRTTSHRLMMLRNMAISLLEFERIETTDAKAKEVRRLTDSLVTLGKRGDLHARRQALSIVNNQRVVKKLFDEIAPRYVERNGGYTQIYKTRTRPGDAAPLSVVQLIPTKKKEAKPKKRSTKKQEKVTDAS